jgi:flavin-dependent dehydrogenase
MNHDRVLIVGAGLAGLALARALGHAGLAPQVVEWEAGWDDAGTGMYLPPTASASCGPWAWKAPRPPAGPGSPASG